MCEVKPSKEEGKNELNGLCRTALTSPGAFVAALKQTGPGIAISDAVREVRRVVRRRRVAATAARIGRGRRGVFDITLRCKLGLDGRRVDSVGMQALSYLPSKAHVPLRALALDLSVDLDMDRSNDLGVTQLPDVEMMRTDYSGKSLDVLLDVIDTHPGRHGLEKDTRSGLTEGNGRGENDDSDHQRNARIHVESPVVIGQPNDQGRGDHADISKSITHDMQENTPHVQIMTMTVFIGFLGLGLSVVVRFVKVIISMMDCGDGSMVLVGVVPGSALAGE